MDSPVSRAVPERVVLPALQLRAPDPEALRPYAALVTPPQRAGERAFYSAHFGDAPRGTAPVLHTNHVPATALPATVDRVEQHPRAAQCFLPLDVSRYAVVVMPSDEAGLPDPAAALAFLVPGTMGIVYAPGVWHMGATVLDRTGHFAVLMWRGGPEPDDIFRSIPPHALVAPD